MIRYVIGIPDFSMGGRVLKRLNIQDNPRLESGSIPSWIKLLPLEKLQLSNSNRVGPFPNFQPLAQSLVTLSIGNNNFSGHSLPDSIYSLRNLITFCNQIANIIREWGKNYKL